MNLNKLQQAYCNQLIQYGIEPYRASTASRALSRQDFVQIGEIWSAWGKVMWELFDEDFR